MSRGRELAHNTIIIVMGRVSTQFVSFLLLPLYTSLLATEEYGIVDLFTTYSQLLLPVVTLMIEQGVFRYLIDNFDNDENKNSIITSSIVMIIGQCILSSFLFCIIAIFIQNDYKYYLLAILIASSFSAWTLQVARGFRKVAYYSLGSFITAGTTIVLNVVFIAFLHMGAVGMLRATMIGNIVCAVSLFICLKIYRYIHFPSISKSMLKDMLKYSIPLIPNQLSLWIINSSDRTIVSLILGLAANGILAISHKFSTIYQTFFSMFQLSWHEIGTVHYNDNDRDEFFSSTLAGTYRLFFSICIGLIAFMPFLFPLMIKGDYGQAYLTVPIYLVAVLFNIVVGYLGIVYVASKNTIEIAKSTIYSGIINIVVHLAMIKYIGLWAAAFSTLIGYFCIMMYRIIDVKKYIYIRYDKRIIISSVLIIAVLLIPYYLNNVVVRIAACGFTVIYAIVINKDIIRTVLSDVSTVFKKK